MKAKTLQVISAESLLSPSMPDIKYKNYGTDVVFTESVIDPSVIDFKTRFDVTTVFVCISGCVKCKIDLEECLIEKNTVLIIFPGQIVSIEEACHARGYAMLISTAFINETKLERMKRANFDVYVGGLPICKVEDEEMEVLKGFYMLGRSIIDESENDDMRHVAQGVASACCNTVISYMKAYNSNSEEEEQEPSPNRRQIFERFIDLLSELHAEHRKVSFYAEQLSISVKYLSLVIRECSGRSVQDWINDYLMLRAKTLLANSEMSVKDVASALGFKNQSSFGKYFRKHAGIGPLKYRKTK